MLLLIVYNCTISTSIFRLTLIVYDYNISVASAPYMGNTNIDITGGGP